MSHHNRAKLAAVFGMILTCGAGVILFYFFRRQEISSVLFFGSVLLLLALFTACLVWRIKENAQNRGQKKSLL